MAVAGLEPVVVAAMVMATWMGAMLLRRAFMAPVGEGLAESGGVSAGGSCVCRWHIVVNGGHGSDDGLCGGNPLWVVDCLDDVSWHEVCETRWWWVRWVKMMAAVAVTVPGGSCGGAGSQEVMW